MNFIFKFSLGYTLTVNTFFGPLVMTVIYRRYLKETLDFDQIMTKW